MRTSPTFLMGHQAMRLTIRTQLIATLTALAVTLAGTTALLHKASSDAEASLQTIYADRVVPLRDLKLIADAYAVNIVDTTHKVRSGLGELRWKATGQ